MKSKKRIAVAVATILLTATSVSAFALGTQKADPYTDGGLYSKVNPYCVQANIGQRDKFTDGA